MTGQSKINLRSPDVMAVVQQEVESHYRSPLVEETRAAGGVLRGGGVEVHLAKEFGFCYGVERAIDLAYAASKVFRGRRIFITGEIIHNPDVNEQIAAMGIERLPLLADGSADLSGVGAEDVVIFPAFGAEVGVVERARAIGCMVVDTTCGDVMSVWKRVRQNAREGVTSIIHGKATHEETRATASRALDGGAGHYLIVRDAEQARRVCEFIVRGGDAAEFLREFAGAHSPGFDPVVHLKRIGVANQTTMLRSETEEVQEMLRRAIVERDGSEENFRRFDTICGATQERQDALFGLLRKPLDVLLVIGGYNSSNTTHLVEIGRKRLPTFFVRDATRLLSAKEIRHFDLERKEEVVSEGWLPGEGLWRVGITAGASCPNNLIEAVMVRLFELDGGRRVGVEGVGVGLAGEAFEDGGAHAGGGDEVAGAVGDVAGAVAIGDGLADGGFDGGGGGVV